MGKLKEELLNNLTPEEMDERFELSAFEYVELTERYKIPQKEDEYIPTDVEMEKLEQMVKDYYNSKEFREYVENYEPINEDEWTEEMEKRYWEEQPPYPFATDIEIEAINESNKVKYTDNDILYVLDGLVEPDKIGIIKDKLNGVWNNKNGVF
jgi:hypothetical protein